MAERITFEDDRDKTIIRTPSVSVKIIRWDWDQGRERSIYDITHAITQVSWQKTIKTPSAGASITCIPQVGDIHLLDYLNTMDVVQIFEFDTLKFQGYIRSIDATGQIDPKGGKPNRMVSIKVQSFGNLLLEGEIGLNAYLALGDQGITASMTAFAGKLADVVKADGSTFADIVKTIVEEWLVYLEELGATTYAKYFKRFVDYETGIAGKAVPGYPRELRLFRSEDDSMSLWSVIQKVCEPPFNEVWFDNGPRTLYSEASKNLSGRPTKTDLPSANKSEKTYLVVRSTPFDGTVQNDSETTLWTNMPARKIPLGYLLNYSLSKSMDEMYSFFMVRPSALDLSDLQLTATGSYKIDQVAFNKYLYKPLSQKQFFSRHFADGETKQDSKSADILQVGKDAAGTLLAWNQNNDQFLSGSFTMMVPSDEIHDPRIGDKIHFEGLENDYFYCEGVSHNWSYGGTLTATLSVTRGYNANKPIELKDKIFRRGLFAMNNQFNETS